MSYYLVVYSHRDGAVEIREFAEDERAESIRARFEAERIAEPGTEVVVLAARSREELEHTHSRYFASVSQIARHGADRAFERLGPGVYRLGRAALV